MYVDDVTGELGVELLASHSSAVQMVGEGVGFEATALEEPPREPLVDLLQPQRTSGRRHVLLTRGLCSRRRTRLECFDQGRGRLEAAPIMT